MKNKLLTLGAILLLTGCTTLYTAIVTVTQVRNSAMTELARLSVNGMISPETDTKIDNADNIYLLSAKQAQLALETYKNGGPDNRVATMKAVKNAVSGILDILAA